MAIGADQDLKFTFRMKDASQAAMRKVQGGLKKTGAAAKGAAVGLKGASVGLAATSKSAQAAAVSTKAAASSFGLMAGAARQLQVALGGMIGAFALGSIIKQTGQFETAMQRMVGLVGLSQEQVDAYNSSVLNMGRALGRSPQELAEALFVVTSAGARGTTALEILESAGKAAAAGLGETKDIARLVTGSLNAYGEENLSAAMATSVLVNTAKEGNFEVSELAGALGRVLPFAQNAGVSLDQVGGVIAALTRVNGSATDSVTALRQVLQTFVKPSEQARTVLEKIGKSSQDLRDMIADQGLLGTLKELRGSLTEVQFVKMFEGVEGYGAIMTLLGENAESVAGIMDRMAKTEVKALDDAFAAVAETAEFKMQQAMAGVSGAMIRLGSVVMPIVLEGLDLLLDNWDEVLTALRGLAYAAGVVAASFVALKAGAIGLMVIKALIMPVQTLKKAFIALNAAMSANPVGLIVKGIAIAVGALVLFRDQIKDAFGVDVFVAFEAGLKVGWETFKGVINNMIEAMKYLPETWSLVWEAIWSHLKFYLTNITDVWGAYVKEWYSLATFNFDELGGHIAKVWSKKATPGFTEALDGIKKVVGEEKWYTPDADLATRVRAKYAELANAATGGFGAPTLDGGAAADKLAAMLNNLETGAGGTGASQESEAQAKARAEREKNLRQMQLEVLKQQELNDLRGLSARQIEAETAVINERYKRLADGTTATKAELTAVRELTAAQQQGKMTAEELARIELGALQQVGALRGQSALETALERKEIELRTEAAKNDVAVSEELIALEKEKIREQYRQKVSEAAGLGFSNDLLRQQIAYKHKNTAQDAGELAVQQRLIESRKTGIAVSNEALAALRENAELQWELANRAETAGEAWSNFWQEYKRDAEDAGAVVRTMTSKTLSTLESGWTSFFTGQEFSWRSLGSKIMLQMAEVAASSAFRNVMSYSMNGLGGSSFLSRVGSSIGEMLGFQHGGAFGPQPAAAFAHGGAFTNQVIRKPTLFQFAQGGVPSLGLMGEKDDEAVMPLTRIGGDLGVKATGMGSTSVSVSPTFNITRSGSGGEGDAADDERLTKILNAELEATVVRVLQREKRSGGMLTYTGSKEGAQM